MRSHSALSDKANKRERWIDIARGFVMLCVILGHMGYGCLNIFIYSFHMPFFFLLAGYFQKPCCLKSFVIKRAKQLLVPYIFTCVCIIPGTQITNLIKILLHREHALSPLHIFVDWIKAILLGSGSKTDFLWIHSENMVGAIWFLLALFIAQVLVNLLIERKYGIILIISIAVFAIFSANYIWLPLSIQAGTAASIFVSIGYDFKHKRGGVIYHNWSIRKVS